MTSETVEINMGDSHLEHISVRMTAIDGLIALKRALTSVNHCRKY
jgi:hypothetical protein